ncbi:MAG: thioredoxin domain-containing protein [Proteobacteria bacterium]|nr:thioredoxin domain-containing protein [Pseudomonadota bacterium]
MIWTIVILVVAVALYAVAGIFLYKGKKKEPTAIGIIIKKVLRLASIVLLIVGVNRLGLGTTYYLTKSNPAILQEMAQNMQAAQQANAGKGVKEYVRKNADDMMKLAPIMGNPNASKTIYLFTDAACPYCRRIHADLARVVKDRNDVRVVVKNFSIHGVLSDDAAKSIIAAKMQDNAKAAAYFDLVMTNQYWPENMNGKSQDELAKTIRTNLMDLAKKAGLNTTQLQTDMNSQTVSSEMAQVRDLAQRFQINGTPYLIIGDQVFPGAIPYEQIVQALN